MPPKASPPKLVFPCSYPVKVIGMADQGLYQWVKQAIAQHSNDPATFSERPSNKGHYIAITAVIKARGPKQISALFNTLKQHPAIKMVL